MPHRYEGIKRSMRQRGLSLADAKTSAAKIFNATRRSGEAPVTRDYDLRRARRSYR